MASSSEGRQNGRSRARRQRSSRTVDVDEPAVVSESTDCIDLTADTSTDDIIDMTRGPTRRRRGSGRRGRRRSSLRRNERNSSAGVDWSSSGTPVCVYLSDESDTELPDPTEEPQQGSSSNNSTLQSPEGVKISCPICMEDVRQIRRSHKKLMSTTCGHIFCNVCIEAAIRSQHMCPTCRKRLTVRSFHPLFI
ncbi:E3 ubiquitin-protein ligase rnf4 [Plakobranchus ocellatus]|uniref:E3 ubiquitin-protein ligase rnf4 n=1 Tax=Plakobranchus ocellatus TaxID=259542 RepID=A0AAV4DU76_9GAST|nr:E3 ubiquitin-protein ligase rnf4 [Plakobranchus ocellatus]